MIIEVRFHGRGGQGAVTSAEIIAQAGIAKGLYAQAFPSFGPERRGAPVLAFLRLSDQPIRLRSRVYKPDHVLILDPTLLGTVNPTEGLKEGGFIIMNSNKTEDDLRDLFPSRNIIFVDATKIAREELGVPITNTTMLGALVRVMGVLDPQDLEGAVKQRFGVVAQKNISAYLRAFNEATIIRIG
jgi:pyruvate ferredoxin oxidoreductase gamma subunit